LNQMDKRLARAFLNPENVTKDELLSLSKHFGLTVRKDRGSGGHYVVYEPDGTGHTIPSKLKRYATNEVLEAIRRVKDE